MRRVGVRLMRIAAVSSLLLGSFGCKTQDDAAAAAKQMVDTAQTLSNYYDALDRVVVATEGSRQARRMLNGVDTDNSELEKQRHLLHQRKELAEQIANMAAEFKELTASTASKDTATAASKFEGQLQTLGAFPANDMATKALTSSIQVLLDAMLAHEEIRAAKLIEPVTRALADFFKSEEKDYDEINAGYYESAFNTTKLLMKQHAVDTSSFFDPSLAPFDLKLAKAPTLETTADDDMQKWLAARRDDKQAQSKKATENMADCLEEMDRRVALVTADKTFSIGDGPITLERVDSWIQTVTKELP
jgi:hypothetical protein